MASRTTQPLTSPVREASSDAVVLFSGGRDSSLAVCRLVAAGRVVTLLTCNNGCYIGAGLCNRRVEELRDAFGGSIHQHITRPTYGLFRKLALKNIREDILEDKYNLILLGSQLAIHTEGIVTCLREGIPVLASGFALYEQAYPEQRPEIVEIFRALAAEYMVEYQTPVYDCVEVDVVKYELLEFGISTKSLEGVSLFGDTDDNPTNAVIKQYLERKVQQCRDHIGRRVPQPTNGNQS